VVQYDCINESNLIIYNIQMYVHVVTYLFNLGFYTSLKRVKSSNIY